MGKNGGVPGPAVPQSPAMKLLAQPRPPKWPFFLGDAALLAVASAVGYFQPAPLSNIALSIVFGCVALGAVLAGVPFLTDFIASQREAEAQLLANLAAENHKLAHSAEILVGTTGQLKSAHEAATRAVHTAEALPYRMQEKLGEFTAQLQESEDEEKAAMAKELEALRETEGERLSAMADKIRTATKDFLTLEKETRPALEAAVKQSREIEKAITAATAQAQAALAQAEAKFKAAVDTAAASARHATESAAGVEAKLGARIVELQTLEREGDAALVRRIEQLKAAAKTLESISPPRARRETDRPVPARAAERGHPDEGAPVSGAAAVDLSPPVPPITQLSAFPRAKPELTPSAADEPVAVVSSVATEAVAKAPAVDPPPVVDPPPKREPRRKATARNVGETVLPGFADQQVIYDEASVPAASVPAKTSDGTTRLLVTAYIGIGNRVFLRGEGPGLSREKGVPMEFISIGKWAWQTADATAPVKVQLYKNDEIKAQGDEIELPPGHHVETTPLFHEPDPF